VNLFKKTAKKFFYFFSKHKQKVKKITQQHQLDKLLVSSLNKKKFPKIKQLKYLGKILSVNEKRKIQVLLTVVLVCVILIFSNLYLMSTMALPKSGGDYTEGLVGAPQFINPLLAQSNDVDTDLSKLVFSGLLKYDKNSQLVPDLAQSHEISDDQLIYTFHLKKDVKWHDNEPFKADDVVFTIASIQDPEFKSPLSRSFRGVSAEKIDDYTVKITLKEPFAPFLGMLTFGILPEHLWYNIPPANADLTELNKKPIGTGAWQVDSFKKDQTGNIKSFTLLPFKNYYGPKPYLDKIIFKFYGDFASAIDALKNKNVLAISYLPKENQNDLKKLKTINYHDLNQPQYTAIFFNQKNNEFLKADYIRQSLAMAIDRDRIVADVFSGDAKVINGPNLPGIGENPDLKKYPYDPQKAVALLEANGWKLTSTSTDNGLIEQVRTKTKWTLGITLTTVDQSPNIDIANRVKDYWDKIGVKTTLEIVDKSKIVQENINNRKYEALLFGENLGADPDPFPFWHSSQNEYPGLNLAIFTNKKVDDLLENARKNNNWEARKTSYLEFQKIVAEELPAIFLYNPIYIYVQDQKIQGFDIKDIAQPADRFNNINEWYIQTRRVWKK